MNSDRELTLESLWCVGVPACRDYPMTLPQSGWFANHSMSFNRRSYVICAFTYHIVELVFVLSYIWSHVWWSIEYSGTRCRDYYLIPQRFVRVAPANQSSQNPQVMERGGGPSGNERGGRLHTWDGNGPFRQPHHMRPCGPWHSPAPSREARNLCISAPAEVWTRDPGSDTTVRAAPLWSGGRS
jgi:hypothetical protein